MKETLEVDFFLKTFYNIILHKFLLKDQSFRISL